MMARATAQDADPQTGTEPRPRGRGDRDLVDSLVEVLQERISTGEIPAGTWLRQEHLATELGVSRMPVREALRQLQAVGTVEMIANRGARVRLPSTRDIMEVYELHGVLQAHAGTAAAELITSEQLDRLGRAEAMFRQAVDELRAADSDPAAVQRRWHEANTEFHSVIIEASGNKLLADVVESLHHKVPRNLTWIALGSDVRRLERDAAEHAAILDALTRGDGATAGTLLREHAKRASELLVRTVDEIGQEATPARRR
jgi:DNA-binding GntR family transcriptional regulator